jgi:hypothetical protein
MPALAENLFSSDPVLYNHRTQYQSFVLPFSFLAAVTGYSKLVPRRPERRHRTTLVVAFVLSLALGVACDERPRSGSLVAGSRAASGSRVWRRSPRPPKSRPGPLRPSLSLRPVVTVFPVALDQAEYVVLNERTYRGATYPIVTFKRRGTK